MTGSAVRYDGTDAREEFPHEALSRVFRYQGFCPEVGIGLSVPRPPIALYQTGQSVRVLAVADANQDFTVRLKDYAQSLRPKFDALAGYVFMHKSPSCGLREVKVYAEHSRTTAPQRTGQGAFARAVVAALPNLPVIDNVALQDNTQCYSFVARTFAYAHWRALEQQGFTAARLIAFHSQYKYLLMAHSPQHYRRAGRVLADLRGQVERVAPEYLTTLLAGLSRAASRGGHANALAHIQGYVSDALSAGERQALTAEIDAYRRGELPLRTPIETLRGLVGAEPYLAQQAYLNLPLPA